MRQTHALGIAGRTRGILDESEIVGRRGVNLTAVPRYHIAHQHCPRLEDGSDLAHLAGFRELEQALQQCAFGEQGAAFELPQYAKQLDAMLVADSHCDRYRHDAAEHRSPVSNDKTLIRCAEDDEFVTGLHTARLQGTQQCDGTVPQCAEANDSFIVLAVNKADLAIFAACLVQEVDQCRVEFHKALIAGCSMMSDAERRLIASSRPGFSSVIRIIRNLGNNRPR